MAFIEELARENKCSKITLNVNKKNAGSIKAYEKYGFNNIGSIVNDIGNGFIMDDYKMEKIVSSKP
jgi:ribosomal protein S18 acetylase RimI-like enzyme